MKDNILGSKKLQLSRLGLGCMGMSECYGKTDDQESIKTIHRAFELGITHFDTADCYGLGHNEQLLAKAIKGFREKAIIASKCGFVRNHQTGEFVTVNGTAEYIKDCCEVSLKRLKIDYIDLFYLHRADPNTPIEESMGALSDLVKQGKILHIGLSEVSVDTISRANQVYALTAIQSEYSLWHREPEIEVIPLCKSLNIGFVAHGPVGKGFLTGKIHSVHSLEENDLRRVLPRFHDENISHNLTIIDLMQEIANEKNCTPAQLALAWVLAQDENIAAIVGTTQIKHLEENIAAAEVKLSPSELLDLNVHIPVNFAKGNLLPESFARFSNK